MRIAVISDLHIAPGATNRCSARPEELLEIFDELEHRSDRVIVAGDLFDLDRPRLPGDWEGQLREIRHTFSDVVARLNQFDWLYGNHDYHLQDEGVPEERELVVEGMTMLVLHGHQWDMLLKKVPGVPQAANFVAGWLDRGQFSSTAKAFQRAPWLIERVISRLRPGGELTDRGTRGASALLAGGWDVVVAGHSHLLRLVPCKNGLYANSGALCEGSVDWLILDPDEQRVESWRDGEMEQVATRTPHGWAVEDSG